MADDAYKRIQPGQTFRPAAKVWNAMLDVVEDYRARTGFGQAGIDVGTDGRIWIQNDTDDTLPQFSIVGIGEAITSPQDDEAEFVRTMCFGSISPLATARFAIIQNGIESGTVGEARVVGLSHCYVDRTDTAHNFANPEDDNYDNLVSATTGTAEILWIDDLPVAAIGETVHEGSGAPSGGTGSDGDYYKDTVGEQYYGPKTAGSWGSAHDYGTGICWAVVVLDQADTDDGPTVRVGLGRSGTGPNLGATAAAWSSTVEYQVGDVVSLSGSNYYCILAHTNFTPPNATYWTLTTEDLIVVNLPDAGSTTRGLVSTENQVWYGSKWLGLPNYSYRSGVNGVTDWIDVKGEDDVTKQPTVTFFASQQVITDPLGIGTIGLSARLFLMADGVATFDGLAGRRYLTLFSGAGSLTHDDRDAAATVGFAIGRIVQSLGHFSSFTISTSASITATLSSPGWGPTVGNFILFSDGVHAVYAEVLSYTPSTVEFTIRSILAGSPTDTMTGGVVMAEEYEYYKGHTATIGGLKFYGGICYGGTLAVPGTSITPSTLPTTVLAPSFYLPAANAGTVIEAENKYGSTISAGMVVTTHSSGTGVILADATGIGTSVTGIAREDIANGVSGEIQSDGLITLADWTTATGSATLAAKANYFSDPANPGKLTTTAPTTTGHVSQLVGVAVSDDTMDLTMSPPILL